MMPRHSWLLGWLRGSGTWNTPNPTWLPTNSKTRPCQYLTRILPTNRQKCHGVEKKEIAVRRYKAENEEEMKGLKIVDNASPEDGQKNVKYKRVTS